MNYVQHTPTEECPLTKERRECSLSDCCGFRSIICAFIALTTTITAALILQLTYDDNAFQGSLNVHGAVATDYTNCSQIGTKILRKGGNAIDAAVAATLCMAVVAPHKTNLGSGGYIMIYSHKDKEKPKVIDFINNTIPVEFEDSKIRIPALLKGLEYAHSMFGQLLWKEIVEPSLTLARKGFEVSRDFGNEATKNPNLGIFAHINAGEILTLPKLAVTLEAVSKFGTNIFYNGSITRRMFSNLNKTSEKLMTAMSNYQPTIINVQESELSQYGIFYPYSPNYMHPIMEEINKLNISKDKISSIESEIIVAEALIKLTRQIKNPYINFTEKRKYTGVSSVDWQDTYVSVITGLSSPLNLAFESDAGFAFDNVNDKNSLLSLTPIVFYDKTAVCGLRGVLSTDDSVVAGQVLYNILLHAMNISTAVEYPRYYVLSDGIIVESDDRHATNTLLRDSLFGIDKTSSVDSNIIMKSVNVIIKKRNLINGHSDSRGDGLASRF